MDDQAGRKIALSRNIPLSGTLGVLERADAIGLVHDFEKVLNTLAESGFFIAETLKQRMLKRHIDRREKK
jgi:predicted nucleic acid-binding protein